MSESKNKLFFVSSDDLSGEDFAGYEKIKITLKPSPDFFSKALDVLGQTSPGSDIAVSGRDCLSVLKAQTLSPGHFNRFILIEPRGAFWWENANNKPEEYFDAFDLFDKITCKVDIIGNGKDLPAWSTILKNADLSLKWKNVKVNVSDENSYLELVRLSGIKVSDGKEYLVKGKAYTRTLSSDIEWDEPNVNDPDKRVSSRSIISVLGWQWEKHWNVYTEEAPFGLMLSVLNEFLIECIRIFHYRPMCIEWSWNGEEYFISKIKPADEFSFSRTVKENSFSEAGNEVWSIFALFNRNVMMLNEPVNIMFNKSMNTNLDVFYYCCKDLGLKGNFTDNFEVKFDFFRYLNSLSKISKMKSLKKFLREHEIENKKRMQFIINEGVKADLINLSEARKKIVQFMIDGK